MIYAPERYAVKAHGLGVMSIRCTLLASNGQTGEPCGWLHLIEDGEPNLREITGLVVAHHEEAHGQPPKPRNRRRHR